MVSLAASMCLAGASATAQTPSSNESRVRVWLEQQLAQPPAVQRLRDLKISYTSRDFPRLTKAEYDLLVIESKKRRDPDDDIKLQLDAIPQRLGFDTFEHTVWWEKSGSWRFNTSYPNNDKTRFLDVSVTKDAAWQVSPKQLTLLDPSRPAPNSYDLATVEQQINSDISQLVDAWINSSLAQVAALSDVTVSNQTWTAEIQGTVFAQRVSGRWDSELNRAFVERTVMLKTPHPDGPGLTIEYFDWTPLAENSGTWIARRLVQRKPDGRNSREVVVASITALDKAEFKSVTRPPSPTGADPIRGKLTVTTVYDFGQGVRTSVDPATSSQTQTGVLPRLADEELVWRRIGWFALAGVVAFLVGTRLFQRFGRR